MKNKSSTSSNPDPQTRMSLTDRMAIERTKLANERTFLSYLRTSLALLAGGVTIIHLDVFEKVYDMGLACLIASPIVLAFALFRFFHNKKRFNRLFSQPPES